MKSNKSNSINNKELPTIVRFYLYGLHGIMIDVCYFAILDSVNKRELDLVGRTSILTMPIFGVGFLFVERISLYLRHRGVPFYIRGLIYTVVGYTFEFSTGYLLSMFGHGYWDYSDYHYNFKGQIIPYTAPGWFLLSLAGEYIVIDGIRKLTLVNNKILK